MGCMPSRQRNNANRRSENNGKQEGQRAKKPVEGKGNPESSVEAKTNMNPTISMMSDHTLKLLQEIGELKVFTQVNPSESKQKMNRHLDILLALENPQSTLPGGTANADNTRSK